MEYSIQMSDISFYYSINLQQLLGWTQDDMDTFTYLCNQKFSQRLSEASQTMFLDSEYLEYLTSTFIVTSQYLSITKPQTNFKHLKASLLFSICFYLIQEESLAMIKDKFIPDYSEFFNRLLKYKLINNSTLQNLENILHSFVNPNLECELGEHADALLIQDVLHTTDPTILLKNGEIVGMAFYIGDWKKAKVKSPLEASESLKLIPINMMRTKNKIHNPFLKNYVQNNINALLDHMKGK